MIHTPIQYIGKLTKPFGYKGEITLKFDVAISENFEQSEILFIKLDGLPVPFFVQEEGVWIKDEQTAIIKFDTINNEIEAKRLTGKEVSAENYIQERKVDSSNINSLKDYSVNDVNLGQIGVFDKIIEIPNNPLIQIHFKETEILLPFTEEIILNIDNKNKTIEVNSPKGLIDIYLEK